MASEIPIQVSNLRKCYQIYEKPQDRLKQLFCGRRKQFYREFWALKDISFEVRRGETVGIVGRNGAGKSTLLQIICGTLPPTDGVITVRGRVAALLELGSGFNPEFTGRENVYMQASIMGLSREEIDARYESTVAFADIGEFIDQPVKTYSSGMHVRLAFAVAISVEPDILIVDEALSVGDTAFQRKCFSRIQTIQNQGGTILFVSHSPQSVIELCERAILLEHGELLLASSPRLVLSKYQKLIFAPPERVERVREEIRQLNAPGAAGSTSPAPQEEARRSSPTATVEPVSDESYDPGMVPKSTISFVSRGATIKNPSIVTPNGKLVNVLVRGKAYLFTFDVEFTEPARRVRFGMGIKTLRGTRLGGSVSHTRGDPIEQVESGRTIRVKFRFRCQLQSRDYFLDAAVLGVVDGTEVYLHRQMDVAMFRVQREAGSLGTGMVDFLIEPQTSFVEGAEVQSSVHLVETNS
jgi:lipopolysaccharide transport system ATP-binding protein